MTPRYLVGLGELLTRVEATDASGAALALDDGLARAMDIIRAQTAAGRTVILIGNGGSAATAGHLAVDFWKNGGMRAVAFNDASLLTCVSNDFGYRHVFEKPIEMFAEAGDVLVALSASGQSENILRGGEAARAARCRLVTLSGFRPDNPLRRLGELNFYAPSDSYGHVEITHLALCHAVVDAIMAGPR